MTEFAINSQKTQEYQLAVSRIRQKFVSDIANRLALFDDLVTQVEAGANLAQPLTRICGETHKIAGVAKTLGFSELGDLAADIELAVHQVLCSDCSHLDIGQLVAQIDVMLDHMEAISQQYDA